MLLVDARRVVISLQFRPTNILENAASKMKAIYLAILPTSIKLKHIDCLNGNAIIDFEFFFWLNVILKPLF